MTYTTAFNTLKINVEDKISNLTGSETVEDLIILKKASSGLNCSNSSILDAAIQTITESQTTTTLSEDLMLANKSLVEEYSGNYGLVMPAYNYPKENVYVIVDGTKRDYGSTQFRDAGGGELSIYDSAATAMYNNTGQQVIIDTGSGHEGILTHLISHVINTVGNTCTFRVTVDEGLSTEKTHTLFCENRFVSGIVCWGSFQPVGENHLTTPTLPENEGFATDAYYVSNNRHLLMVPPEAWDKRTGIVYTDSLKVTVQQSATGLSGYSQLKLMTVLPIGVK
jgi:hypothetical protein